MHIRRVVSQGKNKIVAFSSGKFVSKNNQVISRIVVVGSDRKRLAALIYPNLEAIATWAKTQGLQHLTETELLTHPKTRALIEEVLKAKVRSRLGYRPLDDISDFQFVLEAFTPENDSTTPTLQIQRDKIEQLHKS
ncbi:MAG: hypothetical protein N2235_12920 [Fischerella sp.]|nr:hypothetical protein [Fischerella sp.]